MKPRRGRKLLVASLGVAAVNYVACGGDVQTSKPGDSADGAVADGTAGGSGSSGTGPAGYGGEVVGNLGGAGGGFAGAVSGNLMPPPTDASTGGAAGTNPFDVVANLVAPFDAGPDVQGDAADGAAGSSFFDVVANLVAPPPDSTDGKD